MKHKKWIFTGLLIALWPFASVMGFDDTVFDASTVEDLDLEFSVNEEAARPRRQKRMTLEPEVIDAVDLDSVDPFDAPEQAPIPKRRAEPSIAPTDDELVISDQLLSFDDLEALSTDAADFDVPKPDALPRTPTRPVARPTTPPTPPPAVAVQDDPMPYFEPAFKPFPAPAPIPVFQPPPSYVTHVHTAPPAVSNLYDDPKISAHLSDVPAAEAIKAIALVAGEYVVVPEDIEGNVSLRLIDQPWLWAVDSVLKSRPYYWTYADNTLVVQKDSHEAKGPVEQKTFRLRHAQPSILKQRLQSLLSQRGMIFDDDGNSMLIIHDVASSLHRLSQIVAAADIPQRKILIEAKLVEMEDVVARQFGVDWQAQFSDGSTAFMVGNVFNPTQIAARMGISTTAITNFSLSALLNFLEESNKVKIVSSPHVVTLNNKGANLSQTETVFYPTTVQGTAGATVGFSPITAETALRITPRVMDNDMLELIIDVKREYLSDVNTRNVPPQKLQGQSAQTVLHIKNGETAVIGGLKAQKTINRRTGVPVLKDVPVIGWLFGNEGDLVQTNDLMIFITPNVL